MNTDYITKSTLQERGWTETLIRKFLGGADTTKPNPHYRKAAPTQLYTLVRVEAAEKTAEWQESKRATEQRQESAKKAVETKRERLLDAIMLSKIHIPILPETTLTHQACDNYNALQLSRANIVADARPGDNAEFLERITVNYLRHCLTSYEEELAEIYGKVGVREAYRLISNKVYCAIAEAYPHLALECQRQAMAKGI
jgi:hypothetical protein